MSCCGCVGQSLGEPGGVTGSTPKTQHLISTVSPPTLVLRKGEEVRTQAPAPLLPGLSPRGELEEPAQSAGAKGTACTAGADWCQEGIWVTLWQQRGRTASLSTWPPAPPPHLATTKSHVGTPFKHTDTIARETAPKQRAPPQLEVTWHLGVHRGKDFLSLGHHLVIEGSLAALSTSNTCMLLPQTPVYCTRCLPSLHLPLVVPLSTGQRPCFSPHIHLSFTSQLLARSPPSPKHTLKQPLFHVDSFAHAPRSTCHAFMFLLSLQSLSHAWRTSSNTTFLP